MYLRKSTIDLAEYVGLLAGAFTFKESFLEVQPRPGLSLVDGDSKFIVQHVAEALENSDRPFILQHDQSLQRIFNEIVAILRSIESCGVKVCLRYRPRRLNKIAHQLTEQARQQQRSTFSHELLTDLDKVAMQGNENAVKTPFLLHDPEMVQVAEEAAHVRSKRSTIPIPTDQVFDRNFMLRIFRAAPHVVHTATANFSVCAHPSGKGRKIIHWKRYGYA